MSDEPRQMSGHYGMCMEPGHPSRCPRCADRYERDRPRPTIAEFLLARIAEDEAIAREAHEGGDWVEGGGLRYAEVGFDTIPSLTIDATRALAECEAKRRIVEECARVSSTFGDVEAIGFAVSTLAQVYADHPDFDPTWRVAD